jgi:hypothetical protein
LVHPKKKKQKKLRRLEVGYAPTKRPTRHTGDVPALDPHAVKGNPHGVQPNKAIKYFNGALQNSYNFWVSHFFDSALHITLPF